MSFDKFKGIQAEREIKESEAGTIELLLNTRKDIVQKYEKEPTDWLYLNPDGVHTKMFRDVQHLPEFSENALRSYVLAESVMDHDHAGVYEKVILGFYTGCLLSLLTVRTREKGKRTRLYINGGGNKFNNLFQFAKHVDELFVENFRGDSICASVGGYGGSANIVVAKNLQGSNALENLGSYQGQCNVSVGICINGSDALHGIGYACGRTDLVIGNDITGERALSYISNVPGLIIACDVRGELKLTHLEDCQVNDFKKTRVMNQRDIFDEKLKDIVELAESLKGKTVDDTFDIIEKIQAIYNLIKR